MTIAFCVIAFAFLAISMDRHQTALFGREFADGRSRAFRIAGWCGLALALRFVVGNEGWALGLVTYSGCTSLAAGLVYGGLILYERVAHHQP
ncbi:MULTISPECIES: DUF3325 domain-containing protein [Caballeronia]|uniref:DUF3325 domain-containing protein n=1 Tax=Caballeronia TaxID=1827195 RepID=UPI0002387875|nr:MULTISPECIES: DUF3325 domain-containing protein [unclassified Caballeronia]AET94151.1 hypothetical protein BYI23_D006410 [Burkholderia sp. YI23]AQH04398.1 hypothetical protein A9R05_36355 [Burkholderia sp. KK1]BAO91978.1 uncharacterized protein BRPE67_DCDS08230 [Burkholderia sp. RPE67]BBQ01964.1 hypothetical protein BSFA1_70920 [Burkholderia sp. SFA1]MCE4546864.1 DUF3325 domain-containing protein [Caballeronia sp. PC1]